LSETVSQQLNGTKPVEKDALLSNIAKLRKDLLDATPYLPSFDRRQSELQIKAIEKQLEELIQSSSSRGGSKSASKFSFKRSTPSKSIVYQSNIATNRSITPSEPQVEAADMAASPNADGNTTHGETAHPAVASLRLHDLSDQFLTGSDLFAHSTASELLDNASTPEQDRATDISLSSLTNCVVDLTTRPGNALSATTVRALHVTGLKRCIILTSFVDGSALIHDCEQCVFVLAFRQTSQHANIQDFLWIRQTPSPNWSLLPEDQWVTEEKWPASGTHAEQ
ncbi:12778_t:CDS:2, partial [Acaulospora colombiana]